jgi:5-methylcytosine-specific restriction endonuclease McrA
MSHCERQRRYHAAHRDEDRERHRQYWNKNLDRRAALNGCKLARRRYPMSVPLDVDLEATVPFYRECQRRTQETGVLHHVDHIVALSLGGMHTASNLQVLTAEANRKKSEGERRVRAH